MAAIQRRPERSRARQGARSATLDPRGGPLPAHAQRATAVRPVADDSGAAGDVAGAASTVLYPPPPQRPYRCDGYGDYVFMVSRLTPLKRADLLLRALATPDGRGIRAVIAGEGEERPCLGTARRRAGPRRSRHACRAADRDAAARSPGALPRRVLSAVPGGLRLRRRSRRSRRAKPVVTCRDSGGPAELVDDGERGFVCEPDSGSARAGAPPKRGRSSLAQSAWAPGTGLRAHAELGRCSRDSYAVDWLASTRLSTATRRLRRRLEHCRRDCRPTTPD